MRLYAIRISTPGWIREGIVAIIKSDTLNHAQDIAKKIELRESYKVFGCDEHVNLGDLEKFKYYLFEYWE